jgi:hypothetical protein
MDTIEKSKMLGMCTTPSTTPPAPGPQGTSVELPLEFHICAGLNACRGHDRYGTNECAGTGYCATAASHSCHTLNNCRNQGGCGLYGDAVEQETPGQNNCSWQGSCAVPVQAERFSTLGTNKGKSVWVQARKLFEARMTESKRTFGPAPFHCGPPQAWLVEILGSYDSCGNSGNKYCSFGFNDPAKDAAALCKNSDPPVGVGGVHCSGVEANHSSGETNKCSADKR